MSVDNWLWGQCSKSPGRHLVFRGDEGLELYEVEQFLVLCPAHWRGGVIDRSNALCVLETLHRMKTTIEKDICKECMKLSDAVHYRYGFRRSVERRVSKSRMADKQVVGS